VMLLSTLGQDNLNGQHAERTKRGASGIKRSRLLSTSRAHEARPHLRQISCSQSAWCTRSARSGQMLQSAATRS
jgi:hypothetical protein